MKKCLAIVFLLALMTGVVFATPGTGETDLWTPDQPTYSDGERDGDEGGDERCACSIPNYSWAINENESCTQNNNGGCSVNPPAFRDIECNVAINGKGKASNGTRDQDWYRITLTGRDSIIWKAVAEYDIILKIMGPGPNGCSDRITYAGPDTARECDTAMVSVCLEPGTYWLYAAPRLTNNLSCREYFARVICLPCQPPEPPAPEYDMGDLPTCNYPTLVNNPAHAITGIAWLGDAVTSEQAPYLNNQDPADDGVDFMTVPWTPCYLASVSVKVTGGERYAAYADSGHVLYLNAWKDGNLDGDFCDVLCNGNAPEWIIQDVVVVPRALPYVFDVLDPGRQDMVYYDGIFRFRLTSRPIGAMGFGLLDVNSCPEMTCGTFDKDYVGEVEDYIVEDLQLSAELGIFDAISGAEFVTLRWNTLSEQGNDRFEIERDGSIVAQVRSLGNSPNGHTYQWTDESVEPLTSYHYSLYAVDLDGTRNLLGSTDAAPNGMPVTVTEYALHQNYPNPFNPTTNISFDLIESGLTTLEIYNPVGQLVATLVNGQLSSGRHTVTFDASGMPSGMYLYRLQSGTYSAVKKMMLMK